MLIHIATIIGAHGIKGEVKIRSFTSTPKAFANYGPLTSATGASFSIRAARAQKDDFLCVIEGVVDRDRAEALRGIELFVSRERLAPLKQGEYYLAELLGKSVTSGGKSLGIIKAFQNFGAGDLLELEDGLLIPTVFISVVHTDVEVRLPKGYLDVATDEDKLTEQDREAGNEL